MKLPLGPIAVALSVAAALTHASHSAAKATTLPVAPVAAESFDVGTLHVERFGSGPTTLVLIPGLASGTWTWYGTIAHEVPNATIYALTLPGFDGRPPSSDASLFAGFDRDFQAFLKRRELKHPIVVGHSLGGTLAIATAEKHPSALRAVVAVDGLPIFPPLAAAGVDARKAAAAKVAASIGAADPEARLRYDRQYMTTIGTIDPTLVDPIARLQARSDPHAEAAWLAEDMTTDLRPSLPAIAVPLAEFMPFSDLPSPTGPTYTLDQTKAFYASLFAGATTATVVPIEHSRHYAMLDAPQTFYAALDAFIAALPPV